MHESELYDRLLGRSAPLFFADVKPDTESQQFVVFVEDVQGLVAWFGNPDPVDMKVYYPCGEEAFDDEETTKEAPARRDHREVA